MASSFAPSGRQWTIEHGDQQVTVVEVGGGLREYVAGGRPVLYGYPVEAKADAGRGQLMMPWPNRVRDGRYAFDGQEQQLALTEPARGNASHGLVRWASWELAEHTGDALTVTHRLHPQQGWDHPLELAVRYELGDGGLTVTPSARATGRVPAPFGFGAHPYLTAGEESVDELTLTVPADTVVQVDDRLLPVGTAPVAGELDLRAGRALAGTCLDHAFTDLAATDLAAGPDGTWQVTLAGPAGSTTLWAQADAFGYVQVFTGDSLPPGRARRTGVAVEPMTCPADALNSGDHLLVLEPGQTWSASWGISPG